MREFTEQELVRREKCAKLRELGLDPFGHKFERSATAMEIKDKYKDIDCLSGELAVLSDPAYVTELCGTHADFLIPSACLNATVSGLISRTVKLPSMTDDELHGAVYYSDYEDVDKSMEFINKVESYFETLSEDDMHIFDATISNGNGWADLMSVQEDYKVKDINFIKPGVGESTRVLLRRVPHVVLVKSGYNKKYPFMISRHASEYVSGERNIANTKYDWGSIPHPALPKRLKYI